MSEEHRPGPRRRARAPRVVVEIGIADVYEVVSETRDTVRDLVATVKAQGEELAALKPRVNRLERALLIAVGVLLTGGTGLGAVLSAAGG